MESSCSKALLVQMQKRPMWPPGASCTRKLCLRQPLRRGNLL